MTDSNPRTTRPGWLVIVPAMALLGVASLVAIWTLIGATTVTARNEAVHVRAATSVARDDTRRLELTTIVENSSGHSERIKVWWLASRRGTDVPWENYESRSVMRTVDLADRNQVALKWDETLDLPPGIYELTTWVHHDVNGKFEHADGGNFGIPALRVGGVAPRLSRRESLEFGRSSIADVYVEPIDDDVLVTARVRGGPFGRTLAVELQPTDPRALRWWTPAAAAGGLSVKSTVSVSAEETVAVPLRLTNAPSLFDSKREAWRQPNLVITLRDPLGREVLDQMVVRSFDPWEAS